MRYFISLVLISLGCNDALPQEPMKLLEPITTPAPTADIQPVPFELIPIPTRIVQVPEPVKPVLPEFKRGSGVLKLAIVPKLKNAKFELMILRDLVLYYGGKDWNPWFGIWKDKEGYALIVNKVHWDAAHPFCHWLSWLGWGFFEDRDGEISRLMSAVPTSSRRCEWYSNWEQRTGVELGVDKLTGEHSDES